MIRRYALAYLALAVIFYGAPDAMTGWGELQWGQSAARRASAGVLPTDYWARFALFEALAVVSSALGYVFQAAVAQLAAARSGGRTPGLRDAFAIALGLSPPAFLLGLVTTVAIFVGSVLLVVPGVLIALAWSVGAPVLGVEKTGVLKALRRSAALTRNRRGIILGYFLAWALPVIIINLLLRSLMGVPLLGGVGDLPPMWALIFQPVLQTFEGAVFAAIIVSVYFELRGAKEGIGLEGVAAIFD
jgi:hypothetical protein